MVVHADWLLDHWVKSHAEGLSFMGGTIERSAVAHLVDPATPLPPTAGERIGLIDGQLADPANRMALFNWFYQMGEWVDRVSGVDGLAVKLRAVSHAERGALVPEEVKAVFPQLMLTKEFPPTLLTHGGVDSVVPLEESRATYERLRELGVEVKLDILANAEHGLAIPGQYINAFVEGAAGAERAGVAFLLQHIK